MPDEQLNVFLDKPAVSSIADTVRFQYAAVAPAADGIGMDAQKAGDVDGGQHFFRLG